MGDDVARVFFRQVEASDNGYTGTGGIKTASFDIQVAVAGANDAPVVVPPPPGGAVPGETKALPGFLVLDPDTDTDGSRSEGMIKVSKEFGSTPSEAMTVSHERFAAVRVATVVSLLRSLVSLTPVHRSPHPGISIVCVRRSS